MSARFVIKTIAAASLLVLAQSSQAQKLSAVLQDLMQSSPRVHAAASDQAAAEERAKETFRRSWTPQLDVSLEGGSQKYDSPNTVNPEYKDVTRTSLRATQLIYDFGRASAMTNEADAVVKQSGASYAAASEGVLLDALTAHWTVVRANKVLAYARQSEASVLKQTKLESSMVELGKGYESNVLQAKVQLATAEARRIRAEGALSIAEARVKAVYGERAKDVAFDEVAQPKAAALPASLDEARQMALEHNKQLQIGAYRSAALQERVDSTRAKEYLPRVQVYGEAARRKDMDGVTGSVDDRKIMFQLQYGFNLGMAGSSSVDAVRKDLIASRDRENDTRELVLEQVTIAWRNLLVARSNRDILQNQVNIAAKFLEMASAERQLGRRSLLDVLSAEMSLINAQSDLAATEADHAIAGLTLLQAVGRLSVDAVEFQPAATTVAVADKN